MANILDTSLLVFKQYLFFLNEVILVFTLSRTLSPASFMPSFFISLYHTPSAAQMFTLSTSQNLFSYLTKDFWPLITCHAPIKTYNLTFVKVHL